MRAACFSVAAMDFFPSVGRHFAGGNSLNQTIRYRQLGYESAFVGALGTDEAGDRIAQLLRKSAVDVSHLCRLKGITACNQIDNDKTGERFGVEGAWRSGVYVEFRLSEADWEFISGFDVWSTHADGPNYLTALERKTKGQLMSVDFLHLRDYALLEKSLRTIDIAYFGGSADMADDLARISKVNRGIIVLTLGAEGSIAFEDGRRFAQNALPIERVVDTTGCGDAFQAAFTACYFHTKDIPAALLAGANAGKEAAMSYGGAPWR